MSTGLVVTSRITHATPASFSSHVIGRDDESAIAVQQIGNYTLGKRLDLMFGGGKCFFLPKEEPGSCRSDSINVMEIAKNQYGWNIGTGISDFKQMTQLPLLNLFAHDHMAYNIDRNPDIEPSLAEMTLRALELLRKDSNTKGKGFFLMIEGSRIDMAGHRYFFIGYYT